MDPDFLREIIVLVGFLALYLVGSMLMLRGHKTDLSAVSAVPHGGGEGTLVAARLNRRRKAQARDASDREARRTAENADNEDAE